MKNLIRFDWAMKRLLRNKANFDILEGFLSELTGEDIKIENILDNESAKKHKYDKYNRVDILVKNTKGELIIIEVQNDHEHDYLLRILFGTSKLLVDNMEAGMRYKKIKKIISVNIVYFDLGHGEDYLYHGKTNFIGMNKKDTLKLSHEQQLLFKTEKVEKLYPEYYVIKVNQFDDIAKNTLDEWIYFLKKEEIKDGFKAKGLKEAKKRLSIIKLSETERKEYERYIEQMRYEENLIVSNYEVGELKGREEERKIQEEKQSKEKLEMVRKLLKSGVSADIIMQSTGLSREDIEKMI